MKYETNDIFLTYANNSFIKDPENIYKVFKAIRCFEQEALKDIRIIDVLHEPIGFLPGDLNSIIDEIINLAKCGSRKAMEIHAAREAGGGSVDLINEIKRWPHTSLECHNAAYNAVYRNCTECDYNVVDDRMVFHEDGSLKCYECDQLEFISIIDDIINKNEYDDIAGFQHYLHARNKNVVSLVDISNSDLRSWGETYFTANGKPIASYTERKNRFSKDKKPTSLNERRWFSTYNFFHRAACIESPSINLKHTFSEFLMVFVGYSLIEFLLNTDRRKLKKCPHCGIYFIAKNISRKRCYSDDCKKEYERQKKQIQRDKYPLKYVS